MSFKNGFLCLRISLLSRMGKICASANISRLREDLKGVCPWYECCRICSLFAGELGTSPRNAAVLGEFLQADWAVLPYFMTEGLEDF